MKQLIFFSFLAFLSSQISAQDVLKAGSTDHEVAADNVTVEKREIKGFNQVRASKGINVTLEESKDEYIEIHIKNGDPADVITELSGKKLTIKIKTRMHKDMSLMVYVNYKQLNEIETVTGASIEARNTIYADKLTLFAGSDSNIVLEVDAKEIEATVNASRIELNGACKTQVITANTGGKYLAPELQSENANAKGNVGARIELNVSKKLVANASSGAKILYVDEPNELEFNVSVGGKVMALEEDNE